MTLKAHLIVFDGEQIDRRSVIEKIDGLGSIENWHFFFSNTMCVASPKPARELAADIRSVLPEVSFVITTVDPNEKGGWLPKAIWDFLNNPAPAKLKLDA